MIDAKTKLITILGPTASGKTALALDLAQTFGGEIICADSRTIYRGMDIGTAKPTEAERARVPHHLLNVVDPGETLSAGAFKRLAEAAIADIHARGNVPFLVGGSGLYIDAVIFDYEFPEISNPALRAELDGLSTEQLQNRLVQTDPEAYEIIDIVNRRRLIRAIETTGQARERRPEQLPNVLTIGLTLNKEVMQSRIQLRVEKMLEEGFLSEVKQIGETYGWESEAMSGIGYRAFKDVILGGKTVAEATHEFVHGDMMLVKKQLTWFRRNKSIQWLDDAAEAEDLVRGFLSHD